MCESVCHIKPIHFFISLPFAAILSVWFTCC